MAVFSERKKCLVAVLVFSQISIIQCIETDHEHFNITRYGNPEERSGHLEGDILVNLNARNGLNDPSTRWANRVMPFTIEPGYSAQQVQMIFRAAEIISQNSCIFIRPKKTSEQSYVRIQDGNKGCSSFIGFQSQGAQEMNLAEECFEEIGTIIHEFLHCLGFVHQHCSPERDMFINLLWRNIDPDFQDNFQVYPASAVTDFGVPYDPFSVMHYSADAFSKDGRQTIELKVPNSLDRDRIGESIMGQRRGLTENDIKKLNRMYEC